MVFLCLVIQSENVAWTLFGLSSQAQSYLRDSLSDSDSSLQWVFFGACTGNGGSTERGT